MSKLVLTLMVVAASFTLWAYDLEGRLQEKAYRVIQYAMENSVHDAGLYVDKTKISQGTVTMSKLMPGMRF